jgi:hypothetical protein
MRVILLPIVFLCILNLNGCAVYDVDSASNNTLSGSISRAIHKDRGRYIKEEDKYNEAPTYVDYSKSNPLLRHDDEFDEDQKIVTDDPFEEQVEFSDYQKMKKRQQAKRSMEQDHKITDEKEAPVSLW